MTAILCNDIGEVGLAEARAVLKSGGAALDAVEAGIRLVEADPAIGSVGRGGWPNAIGEMELDAGIMDGGSLAVGAVGAVPDVIHAISLARQVLEQLPHVLLVGPGAARFAHECGLAADGALTDRARAQWLRWFETSVSADDRRDWPDVPLAPYSRWSADPDRTGTTVWLVVDSSGSIAAGASTCGWAYKYPGRVGDSCVSGAGFYADDRFGAAACTGAGELTMRACTARSVVAHMSRGLPVRDAVCEAADELRSLRRTFVGGVTLHALAPDGQACVLSIGLDPPWGYRLWHGGDAEPSSGVAHCQEW